MDDINLCRVCANFTSSTNSTNLFDRKTENRCLLGQIKEITGCSLRNAKNLPKFICEFCEESLKQANQFRKRCQDSQLYFCSAKYKEFLHKKPEEEIIIEVETEFDDNNDDDIKKNNILFEPLSEALTPTCEQEIFLKNEKIENEHISDENEFIALENVENSNESEDETAGYKSKRKEKKKAFSKHLEKKSKTEKKEKDAGKKLDYMCDQCGNHFTTLHHFKTHLRRHNNDKRYQCEICPDKFFTHSELKRHMRRHTGERPFACQHCQRRFTDYSTRVKHERIHTNDRPFKCPQCDKAFTTSYVLKNHMLIHTGQRSFKCQICDKAFQRQVHLVVHYRSISHKQAEEKCMRQTII